MTLSIQAKRTTRSALLLAIFAALFYHPTSTYALDNVTLLPGFSDFAKAVQNGSADVLRGVYVDDVLALPIVQQPSGSPAFVSNNDGEITQFGLAGQYGNVGLLAHNNLSGRLFSSLAVGQQVRLVYGDGKVESFVIARVLRYQALQPTSPYSSFRNLDDDAKPAISADQMFRTVYMGDRHVTFQTCIEAYGNSSWGRLFVIAVPKSEYLSLDRPNIERYQ